ncbi:MAG: right-handed parallel beta-helix repeat-containing protein [Oscillospiraceae bacterium]|nr:right-handed parallel beta-helix repeat-containing protein [Oscillospiraceae bacterium]
MKQYHTFEDMIWDRIENGEALPTGCRCIYDFGAAGDGVTDDTQALQAAATCGETVWFPAGIYLLRGALEGGAVVRWIGVHESSIIRLEPYESMRRKGYEGGTVFTNTMLTMRRGSALSLRSLRFDANKEAFDADAGGYGTTRHDHTVCVEVFGGARVTLKDCTFTNALIEGVYIDRTPDVFITGCRFHHNGFWREDASGIQIATMRDPDTHIRLYDCAFDENGFNGLLLNDVEHVTASDITCHGNGFDGIAFWGGSSRCSLERITLTENRGALYFGRGYTPVRDNAEYYAGMPVCKDISIRGLVTEGNGFGICWGCAEDIKIDGWYGRDAYVHRLYYLGAERPVTAVISGADLAPSEGFLHDECDAPDLFQVCVC